MVVTVSFKHKEAKVRYRMELNELQRLRIEYESYLKSGEPLKGWYICRTVYGDPNLKTDKFILFNFEQILFIG